MIQKRASAAERELALQIYQDDQGDDIQIDDGAPITQAEDGIWVQAWVFVSNETLATSTFGALGT